jgi:glucose-1-phosphate thymidylyltransferase
MGYNLTEHLARAIRQKDGVTVFAYRVKNPERYGVVEFNQLGQAISVEEKPLQPKSNYALTGLCFHDHSVVDIAASLKLSARGELEITDIIKVYLPIMPAGGEIRPWLCEVRCWNP